MIAIAAPAYKPLLLSKAAMTAVAFSIVVVNVLVLARYKSVAACVAVMVTLPTFLITRLEPLTVTDAGSDDA